ncbi:MAG: hypothetical protein SNJ77_04225 [Cytophagales bacterium]
MMKIKIIIDFLYVSFLMFAVSSCCTKMKCESKTEDQLSINLYLKNNKNIQLFLYKRIDNQLIDSFTVTYFTFYNNYHILNISIYDFKSRYGLQTNIKNLKEINFSIKSSGTLLDSIYNIDYKAYDELYTCNKCLFAPDQKEIGLRLDDFFFQNINGIKNNINEVYYSN